MHTFLTMSLTASIAASVVMVLRLFLKKVPRWVTCLLWAVVLLRMVCPVGFSLPVSLMPETVSSREDRHSLCSRLRLTSSRRSQICHQIQTVRMIFRSDIV